MSQIGWWKLDNDYNDYSGNSNHGTNSGTSLVTGKINKGADFENSSGHYVALPNFSELSTFSFSSYIKLESLASDDTTFRHFINLRETTLSYRFNIYTDFSDDKVYVRLFNSTGTYLISDTQVLNVGTYYHIAVTMDGSTMTLYINGEVVGTPVSVSGTLPATNANKLGSYTTGTNAMDGIIDDARLFDNSLTQEGVKTYMNYRGRTEIVVNGIDISQKLFKWKAKEVFAKAVIAEFSIIDPLEAETITYSQQCDIYFSGTLKYTGIIYENLEASRKGIRKFRVYSKVVYLLDRFISVDYTGQTIDYVIKDIIDIYFSGVFTYTNVVARTLTYDISYNGQSAWYILQDLAKRENLQLYIDENNDIHLTSLFSNDSGRSYSLESTAFVKEYDFPDVSQTIKNSIIIYSKQLTPDGLGGVGVRYNNLPSISQYGRTIEHAPLTFNELETETQCISKGKEIIDEIAFVLQSGEMVLGFDGGLSAGQIIKVTYSKKGWINQEFVIKTVIHKNRPYTTTITIAEVKDNTIDLLISVINALRKNEERFRDSTATISNVIIINETLEANMYFSISKFVSGSRQYRVDTLMNGFSMLAGNPTEYDLISDEPMVITNAGKKKILDILTGVSSLTMIDANLWLGLGTGTTPEEVTDTVLETEIDINSDANTKQEGTALRLDDQNLEVTGSVLDADVSNQNFFEGGLFDADAGIMYSRIVTSVAFNKNPNETLRVKIVVEFP